MTDAEKTKKSRAAYYREWRRKNPEKSRRNQENYWKRRFDREQAEAEKGGDE